MYIFLLFLFARFSYYFNCAGITIIINNRLRLCNLSLSVIRLSLIAFACNLEDGLAAVWGSLVQASMVL